MSTIYLVVKENSDWVWDDMSVQYNRELAVELAAEWSEDGDVSYQIIELEIDKNQLE